MTLLSYASVPESRAATTLTSTTTTVYVRVPIEMWNADPPSPPPHRTWVQYIVDTFGARTFSLADRSGRQTMTGGESV
jgi:hypothetical protein